MGIVSRAGLPLPCIFAPEPLTSSSIPTSQLLQKSCCHLITPWPPIPWSLCRSIPSAWNSLSSFSSFIKFTPSLTPVPIRLALWHPPCHPQTRSPVSMAAQWSVRGIYTFCLLPTISSLYALSGFRFRYLDSFSLTFRWKIHIKSWLAFAFSSPWEGRLLDLSSL